MPPETVPGGGRRTARLIEGALLVAGLVLATAPAWRLLVTDLPLPLDDLLDLLCAPSPGEPDVARPGSAR